MRRLSSEGTADQAVFLHSTCAAMYADYKLSSTCTANTQYGHMRRGAHRARAGTVLSPLGAYSSQVYLSQTNHEQVLRRLVDDSDTQVVSTRIVLHALC